MFCQTINLILGQSAGDMLQPWHCHCYSLAAWQGTARPAHRSRVQQPRRTAAPATLSRRTVLGAGLCWCGSGCACGIHRSQWYDKYFAYNMAVGMEEYEQQLHPLKQVLFPQLLAMLPAAQPGSSGGMSLLEVGIGTGPNLPYYSTSVQSASSSTASPGQLSVTGLEPNTAMWGYVQEKAAAAGWAQQQLQLVEGDAQQMPFEDSSFDAAVMTLVLCSVPQPQAVLSELLRVLRPGGQLLLIEHVIAPQLGFLQLQQRLLDPVQRLLADNCHLTRDTAAAVSSTGFVAQPLPPLPLQYGTVTAVDVGDSRSSSSSALPGAAGGSADLWRFEVEGMGLIAPHIAGILRKPL